MKRIAFIDEEGGVWECAPIDRKGINFRYVLQKAKALEKELGIKLMINLINGNHWSDITNWVKMRG